MPFACFFIWHYSWLCLLCIEKFAFDFNVYFHLKNYFLGLFCFCINAWSAHGHGLKPKWPELCYWLKFHHWLGRAHWLVEISSLWLMRAHWLVEILPLLPRSWRIWTSNRSLISWLLASLRKTMRCLLMAFAQKHKFNWKAKRTFCRSTFL